jgi:ferredoxin
MKITVDETKCIGCGTCASLCEECFEIKDGISHVKKTDCGTCDLKEVAESCPVEAITVEEE